MDGQDPVVYFTKYHFGVAAFIFLVWLIILLKKDHILGCPSSHGILYDKTIHCLMLVLYMGSHSMIIFSLEKMNKPMNITIIKMGNVALVLRKLKFFLFFRFFCISTVASGFFWKRGGGILPDWWEFARRTEDVKWPRTAVDSWDFGIEPPDVSETWSTIYPPWLYLSLPVLSATAANSLPAPQDDPNRIACIIPVRRLPYPLSIPFPCPSCSRLRFPSPPLI